MSTRFEAEAVLRAAASGDFPSPGDTLVRVQEGWVFSKVAVGDLEGEISPDQIDSLPFTKILGIAERGQLPSEIAYEDEANVFLLTNVFQGQVRRGIRTVGFVDSPYAWQPSDWHLNVNTDIGAVEVLVPDAASHFDSGFSDQLHIKHVGKTRKPVIITPVLDLQEIDGYSRVVIREPNRSFTLVSDGSDWWIQ